MANKVQKQGPKPPSRGFPPSVAIILIIVIIILGVALAIVWWQLQKTIKEANLNQCPRIDTPT
jgi:flagellar basal body-associated protein FliL